GFAAGQIELRLRPVARRSGLPDLAAVPVEERERQRDSERRQDGPGRLRRVAPLEPHLDGRRGEDAAMGEGQLALRRAQGRGGGHDRQWVAAAGRVDGGRLRGDERVGEGNGRYVGGQSHDKLHREQCVQGGERV